MTIAFLKFIICALVILYCGRRVAKYGDAISEKTGLSGLWIGVILVSIATSLPELFTGVGSTVFVDAPNLTVGNIFGANTYNLFNIALMDILHKGAPLLSGVSSGHLLTLILSLAPLLLAALGIFTSQSLGDISVANISIFSIAIMAAYFMATRIIFKYEKKEGSDKSEDDESGIFKYGEIPLKTAVIRYLFAAAAIALAGIWLAYIGDDLARILDLKQNFIGSLLLGFATTLPEITVSIAALRLGAKDLAVANMLGSNMFNVSIISINDILYRKAPIFNVLSQNHLLTVFIVIFMTVIVGAAMILKPAKKTRLGMSNYAAALIMVFLLGMYLNYLLVK